MVTYTRGGNRDDHLIDRVPDTLSAGILTTELCLEIRFFESNQSLLVEELFDG